MILAILFELEYHAVLLPMSRSWISDDLYAFYQAMAEKNLKTWQLVEPLLSSFYLCAFV